MEAADQQIRFKGASMTPLRQRMIEDMQVLNLAPLTQSTYLLQVTLFARYFGKSPERLTFEHVRDYQIYLVREKKLAASSIAVAVSALRFLYRTTLRKDWNFDQVIPAPQQSDRLPVILSPEEVAEFLGCVQHLRHRTILTVCYAAGLRISEAVRLRVSDIDSSRMVLRSASKRYKRGVGGWPPARRLSLTHKGCYGGCFFREAVQSDRTAPIL
jgi:site-specific recombinase XerD